MNTSPLLAAASASSSSGNGFAPVASGNNQMDMKSFLTMFTTQLKYQDPTNPLQSHELAAQLAQFSTVEKLESINSNLESQQTYLASINNAQMIGAIGKEVTGADDSLVLKNGQQATHNLYSLSTAAGSVKVNVLDDNGNVVRTMDLGAQAAGQYDMAWDGRSDAGDVMPDGTYHMQIEALDTTGNALETTAMVSGTASAFKVEEGIPYLILGGTDGLKLPISSVLEIQEQLPTTA